MKEIINYQGIGGSYDEEGNQKKIGKWVELFEGFWNQVVVTLIGQYNMNGMKVGKWDILWDGSNIGGGSYDEEGNSKKIGNWVELDEGFHMQKQVLHQGSYNKNGMKVDKWDICWYYKGQFGGGSYDKEGNQIKIGYWVELDEKFSYYFQLTQRGSYDLNGRKAGRWEFIYRQEDKIKTIGEGVYNVKEGNQIKIGRWVETDERFSRFNKITNSGSYNINGMKVGRWAILYQGENKVEFEQIGGGSYDKEGNQIKIGEWIELDEKFAKFYQVTHQGSYNKNGMKVGRWDIMYNDYGSGIYQQIGGGSYDEEGNQKKIGRWVELDEKSKHYVKGSLNGEYNMKGQKVGIWVEKDIELNENSGEESDN
ncbi:unnamed protein product [Paramecium sonneborni]|uniref:Uncharacterized protein n=1 Tax=Paramecium sonneborni TaxID=65129 RepID=A0A8S1RTA9_9CILI|nr:unnamed protein product [Paramecium sonneborni]